jgi:shikimate kinase
MKPFLILIDGPIGAGKSTVAKILHGKLKRTALVALDRVKWLVSDFDGSHKDLQLASDVGAAMAREYLLKGINVIVEKAFTRAEFVKSFLEDAVGNSKKHKIFVYQLDVPLAVAHRRVQERPFPLEVNRKPSLSKIKRNQVNYAHFRYEAATRVFDTMKMSAEKIAREILKDVKK